MRAAFRRAADRNPKNWYAWLELGIADALDGRRESALAYLAKAHALDPREGVIASVAESVRAGRHVSPIEIDRKMLRRVAVDQLGRQK
jgi:tetratricopeptide (TPR) repeat protein